MQLETIEEEEEVMYSSYDKKRKASCLELEERGDFKLRRCSIACSIAHATNSIKCY
jgi:hypothetical protein